MNPNEQKPKQACFGFITNKTQQTNIYKLIYIFKKKKKNLKLENSFQKRKFFKFKF